MVLQHERSNPSINGKSYDRNAPAPPWEVLHTVRSVLLSAWEKML